MDDVKLPDTSTSEGSDSLRQLPPQTSAEDTSNWENRAIALPDPRRPLADFILNEDPDYRSLIIDMPNPYIEQERHRSEK